MRAPPPPGRASVAGPVLHLLGPCSSPGGSSLMLAPVAQVSRSPLWLKSLARPCGSSLSPQVALLWPASGSAQLPLAMGVSRAACWCAGSPARITTVVLVGCAVGRARAGAAVRRSPPAPCFSGARRRSEPALSCARIAGPSHCGGSSAPRGCASLGVTGLSAANPVHLPGTTAVTRRPSWQQVRAGPIGPGRARPPPFSFLANTRATRLEPAALPLLTRPGPAHVRQAAQAAQPPRGLTAATGPEPGTAQPGARAASPR